MPRLGTIRLLVLFIGCITLFALYRPAATRSQQHVAGTGRQSANNGRRKEVLAMLRKQGHTKSRRSHQCKHHRTRPLPRDSSRYSVALSFFDESRLPLLRRVILNYQKSPHLDRLFVHWANPAISIPADLMPYALRPTTPSLNERFILPPDLRTDAVFIADDDMLYDMSEVDLAFRTWKTQPMSPVGFFARMHYWDDDLGLYVDSKDQYSIILTKGMFIHAKHLYSYTCDLPLEVHDYIDSQHNCEDIAMSMLTGATGARPIHVRADNSQDFGLTSGISSAKDHNDARSNCLEDLTALFGSCPLMSNSIQVVQYRPNPSEGG